MLMSKNVNNDDSKDSPIERGRSNCCLMDRNYGHCNRSGSNITGKMAAKQLKDFYGKNKMK